MKLVKAHHPFQISQAAVAPFHSRPHLNHLIKFPSKKLTYCPSPTLHPVPLPLFTPTFKIWGLSKSVASFSYRYRKDDDGEEGQRDGCTGDDDDGAAHKFMEEYDDLASDGAVYQNTLRLVECSMFAAVTGLVYFLSNSLSIENYFGCFFSLPIVISSMRWGVTAGRKTMVATAILLFVLSGPVKALTYVLTHGIVGFVMGSLWRLGANWSLSIFLCTIARSMGAVGYVLTSSFLIRENILALITINIHASLTYIFAATGINLVPSMNVIYAIFGILVLLNSGFFVFLLHLLYAVFLTRLGMRKLLRLPRWMEKALV